MSQLSSWILTKIDLLSWLYRVIIFIRKIIWTLNSKLWLMISINAEECVENWDRACHVNFAWFCPPPTEHWTLDAKSWENERNVFLSVNVVLNVIFFQFVYEYSLYWSLRSCPVVYVLCTVWQPTIRLLCSTCKVSWKRSFSYFRRFALRLQEKFFWCLMMSNWNRHQS